MAVLVEDREALRPLLARDPVRNAVVIQRVFHNPEFTLAFADALPEPRAVLALKPSASADRPHQFALLAPDDASAGAVLTAVPKGASVFHASEASSFPALRRHLTVGWWGEAICYRLDPGAFRDAPGHEVAPLEPRHAALVAKMWAPDWPADAYVLSRIEEGPSVAIYEDGEPVAWYLTHMETDDVVMLGFLYVLESHRRRGYATSLSCALIKRVLGEGKTPACHVYTDNGPSIALMEGLGFRRVCVQAWGDGVVAR